MSEQDILKQLQELNNKINELQEGDDLEGEYEQEEPKKRSVMFNIDASMVDSFGDPIELTTKSRLEGFQESHEIAKTYTRRIYHNMGGNRYGNHSILIPVFNYDGTKNKIDMVWFSGSNISIVEKEDREGNKILYYKIRMLVYDVYIKKLQLARIPIQDKARYEEVQVTGAGRLGENWIDKNAPITPMKPMKYGNKTTMKQVGEIVLE